MVLGPWVHRVSSVLSAAVAFVFPAYLMWFSSFADSWLTSRRSSGESDKGTWERTEWKRRRRGEAQGWTDRIENVRREFFYLFIFLNGFIFIHPICWILPINAFKMRFLKSTVCADVKYLLMVPTTEIIAFFFSFLFFYHIFSPHKCNCLKDSL